MAAGASYVFSCCKVHLHDLIAKILSQRDLAAAVFLSKLPSFRKGQRLQEAGRRSVCCPTIFKHMECLERRSPLDSHRQRGTLAVTDEQGRGKMTKDAESRARFALCNAMSVYHALLRQACQESALYRLCVVLLLILELVADDCCDVSGGSCGRCREGTELKWLRRLSPQAAVCDGRQATHSLPGDKEHTRRPHYHSCCARTGSGRSKANSHFRQSAGCHGGRNAGFSCSS